MIECDATVRRLSALTTVPPTTKTDTLVKSKDVFKNIEPRSSTALAGKLFVSCERGVYVSLESHLNHPQRGAKTGLQKWDC